jgi:archaellum component FlaG (FlaF/FlaG flagellin family)
VIRAVIGGFLQVRFACSPGTVTPPDPGTVAFIDPAASFETTTIQAAEPVRQISIDDQTVTEGGLATFNVTLDAASANPITVDFATADGSAIAPGDYAAGTGTVTFAAGDTSEPVTVQTADDALVEGTETFNVNLSNVTGNASIADGTGVGTINDNDVANQAPTANAGPDQTVNSGAAVTLDGSGSTDPEGQTLTYMWTQTSGPAVTLSDPTAVMPTFTAPTGPATLTFDLQVCDPEPLCNTDSVTINVQAPPIVDASGQLIVNGPVTSAKTSKSFVFKVTNMGSSPLTINAGDVSASVDVNGTTTGSVSVSGLPTTLGPGASKRLKLVWSYDSLLATGDTVVFNACVNVTGDIDTTNDCGSATRTAK